MLLKTIFLLLFIIVEVGLPQLQTEDSFSICGAPFLPSDTAVDHYFSFLQNNDPGYFKKLNIYVKSNYAIGEERTFNLLNLVDRDKVKFDQVTATLHATNKGVNIWVDNSEWENGHVNSMVVQNILAGLTEHTPLESVLPGSGIIEIENQIFGMPSDIDNNGTVEFLLADIKDGWENEGGFIGGFFYPRDQQISSQGSNKADIMYIDTYPGIYQSDGETESHEFFSALATVAHEYQHLLQYNNDQDEETFVDEGLSEIASFLCGYGLRDPSSYLGSTELSLVEFEGDDFDVSLNHYAKVALFTYFLLERFGLDFISDIALNKNSGVAGINASLEEYGVVLEFDDVVLDFFTTISTNNPDQDPEYSFNRSELQYLQAQPEKRIIAFPESKALTVKSFSLHIIEITNTISLTLDEEGSYPGSLFSRFYNETGYSQLEEWFAFPYQNPTFGNDYHTLYLYYMNNTSDNTNLILTAEGNGKNYLSLIYEGGEVPSFLISSPGNTNAVRFNVPSDSTYLKSVQFYNGTSTGDILLHLYKESINGKLQPQSEIINLKNALHNSWNRIDVENLTMVKDQNQVFEIGIEYTNKGSMGYHENKAEISRSFLQTASNVFSPLDQFEVSGGTELDGVWMISAEMAAPGRNIPVDGIEGDLNWAGIGPNPFNPSEQNTFNIAYNYNGTKQLKLDIFNTMGDKVYSIIDKRLAGLIYWNGTNTRGMPVASGAYFMRLSSNRQTLYKKILLMH